MALEYADAAVKKYIAAAGGGSTSPMKPLQMPGDEPPLSRTPGTSATPSSGGGATDTATLPGTSEGFVPPDLESYLGMFGLPPDVVKELTAIFRSESDPNRASQRAIAYVRGTDWYVKTYPGIQEALAKGIVANERDYRAKMNDFGQVYRQYAGRDIDPNEYAQHLREGVSADVVGRRFQGAAITDAYGGDWQYTAGAFGGGRLDATQLKALGEQQAGLASPVGTGLQKMIEEATIKLRRSFDGVLASTSLAGTSQERAREASDVGR